MTVNALMLAANQKNNRHPVMSLTEGEVGAALNALAGQELARRDDSLGRVPKWRQQFQHQLLLQPPAFAVLVALMLRGPQTVAELRANAAGLGGPADAAGIATELQSLAERAQPLVVLLPRGAGQKEARYAHTLSGVPDASAAAPERSAARAAPVESADLAELREQLRALEERVAELERKKGPPSGMNP
jgi:uncharacterized protein YceH (UPF0502 family)